MNSTDAGATSSHSVQPRVNHLLRKLANTVGTNPTPKRKINRHFVPTVAVESSSAAVKFSTGNTDYEVIPDPSDDDDESASDGELKPRRRELAPGRSAAAAKFSTGSTNYEVVPVSSDNEYESTSDLEVIVGKPRTPQAIRTITQALTPGMVRIIRLRIKGRPVEEDPLAIRGDLEDNHQGVYANLLLSLTLAGLYIGSGSSDGDGRADVYEQGL
ncbi:uncharacterized protein BDZ99DRAFT_473671 [Mytilinidion resinicola]|uniref:Uncharacterized protein n=1 Tax=Mytilinidion resinicola TaxID=574789 RepID=A0A6A6YWI8_9PEZI|nr:uncharacterized protein BDZ99DRAFT_473671 [Mytilinidion resinicola]KAF2812918.1 hypothetical protein BDZ99DRAFT_473671 [Mytilinidion resinicola]